MAAVTMMPLATTANGEATFSHAVSRSNELLSCAKTALKIGKAQHAQDDDHGGSMWWACQEPNLLALCAWKQQHVHNNSALDAICEDGLSLLRTMDAELTQLETLVRRRGHTNDPTEEIAASVRRLETDAKELSTLVKSGFTFPRATAHSRRHAELIATWLESVATQQMAKLKEILKVRGNVLADQAQRRKMLHPQGPPGGGNGANGQSTAAVMTEPKKTAAPRAMDTPLFTMTPLPKPNNNYANGVSAAVTSNGNTATNRNGYQSTASATSAYGRSAYGGGPSSSSSAGGYGGYGSSGGYGSGTGSYYGNPGGPATANMRQRRNKGGAAASTANHYYNTNQQQDDDDEKEADKVRHQIQQRQNKRQTQNRLEEAQQAESKLAELTTMFSKMANLVSQQGEVLEKVEDDVEAGLMEVIAGQEEITTLYDIKKGNRGLIIKVFGLLIFFIIFMRFYKK